MDEYTQGINLKFISNIDDIQKQLNGLKSNFQANFITGGKSTVEAYNEKSVIQFAEAINEFVDGNNFLSELIKVDFPTTWGSMVAKIGKGISSALLSIFKSAWDEMEEMISYNYISNQSVRQLRLTWGLDAGEAYAYDTAADIMGLSSLEDYSFMSTDELAIFQKASNRLYEVWEAAGAGDTELSDAMVEFKVELEVMKVQLLQPFLKILSSEEFKAALSDLVDALPSMVETAVLIGTKIADWITAIIGGIVSIYETLSSSWLFGGNKKEEGENGLVQHYDSDTGLTYTMDPITKSVILIEDSAAQSAQNSTNNTTIQNEININGREVASESQTYSSGASDNNYSQTTNYYRGIQ